jgi:hypothetical protein
MLVSIGSNFTGLKKKLDQLNGKNKAATVKALNATAWDVKYALKKNMQAVFDRPTPWTLNSTYVKPANLGNMGSVVGVKDRGLAGKGTSAAEYLAPQIYGDSRPLKQFERVLKVYGLLPQSMQAVPSSAVKLDRYGNVSKGLLIQILSQLKVQLTGGYDRRATGSKRSNQTIVKQGVNYFVLTKNHGKLKPGIYARPITNRGVAVYPVFIYVNRTNYRRRFDFFGVAHRTALAKFDNNYQTAIAVQLKGFQ